MVWLVVAYLGSLAVMFAAAFWSTDSFTGALIKQVSWDNFRTLVEEPVYRRIALRTLGVAATVTVVDALIALPIAFYMAKVARPRARRLLVAAILTPLWASYLVKAYAWRILLSSDGPVDWALGPLHLSGPGYGLVAVTLTLAYLWLPFMILPVYAGLDRVPDSLLEASADLGAPAGRTFRSVVLPLIFPALVAGLDLHVLAEPRRLHHGQDRRRPDAAVRQRHLRQHRRRRQPPVRGRGGGGAGGRDPALPGAGPPHRRPGEPMSERAAARAAADGDGRRLRRRAQ